MSTTQTHRLLAPGRIVPSPTNPRKHFDPAKLAELTESVKMRGVLQPILVRKHHGLSDTFEIVCGERRWRAATAAKIGEIPVMVCDLDDEAVLEVQVIENLQRDDLHPLEEAEGYDALVKMHGHTAADIAAKVGKDKSYVNKRMKLLALIPKAREAFYANKITPSIALLLARVPDEKAQAEGLRYSQQEDYQGDLPTAVDISHFLKEKFMLVLKDAPFDIHDATLTAVGACSACPKRTANQTDLFGEDMKGDDRCLDAGCYKKKEDAWWTRTKASAKQTGQTVLEGKAAESVRYDDKFVKLDDKCYDDHKRRTWKQLLTPAIKNGQIKTTIARTGGAVLQLVTKSEALKHSGLGVAQKLSKADDDSKKQAKAARLEAQLTGMVQEAKTAAFIEEVERMILQDPMSTALARILAGGALDLAGHYRCDTVATRREATVKGERPVDVLRKMTRDMEMAELLGLVFELCVPVGRDAEDDDEIVKVVRVDFDGIERSVRDDAKDAQKNSTGARPEAAQPARVGKQTKAVTANAGGKDAPVAKGRAPVFDGDEVTPGFFTKGVSAGKLAPGVLPKAKKEKQSTGYDPTADGYTLEDVGAVARKLKMSIADFREMPSYEQSKELALWRADQPVKEKGREQISVPMPKGYTAGIEIGEGEGGWCSGCRVVFPKTTGGVAVPYQRSGGTRQEALAFAVAGVLRLLGANMRTPSALLDAVRAWATKNKVTKADLKKQDAAWQEKHGV